MIGCINKSHPEYQSLLKSSGLPDSIVSAYSREFLNKYDRFPHLDELPYSNSEAYLTEQLEIKNSGTKIDKIKQITGVDDIKQANILLNNKYRDLEIEITPIVNEAYVNINHRPSLYNIKEDIEPVKIDENINKKALLEHIIDKLSNLYGINIISTNYEEIGKMGITENANAFVYNGDIYINTDVADIDAPIHEMTHLFLGAIRFQDPNLYQKLMNSIQNYDKYNLLAKQFLNRTQNDIAEEILVREFSKHLAGLESEFDNIPDNIKYEIYYNMNRVFDSILMGQESVQGISKLKDLSLIDIAKKVNSAILQNNFKGTLDNSAVHRIASNTKQQLLKEHKLEEYCS